MTLTTNLFFSGTSSGNLGKGLAPDYFTFQICFS